MLVSKNESVLIIVAHFDDETFMCGGLLSQTKGDVSILVLCGDDAVSRRAKFKAAVNNLCPQAKVFISRYDDQRLDQIPITVLADMIGGYLDNLKPNLVITHSDKDLNRDHRVVNEAVRLITRSDRKGWTPSMVMAGEGPNSFNDPSSGIIPNILIEVLDIQKKLDSVDLYELDKNHLLGSKESVLTLAELRGKQAKCRLAEAYELIRLRILV